MITLDQAIETALQLPPQQQEMLIDILHKRQIEARRKEIALDAQRSLNDFRKGKFQPQSLPQVIAELHHSLDEEPFDDL